MAKLNKKHKDFIEVLKKKAFHIANACDAFGIHRQTYYLWIRKVDGFKELIESERMRLVDTVEALLYENALDGQQRAIEKFLQHNYPEKYGERINLEHTGKDGGPIQTSNVELLQILERYDIKDLLKLIASGKDMIDITCPGEPKDYVPAHK
ncbi:MAG: hypothetical protein JRJ62_04720 [Deltaproteobacteria bacterium]|nr:hypothetical protein [Deltaproteobacteria bacterium]